MFVCVSVSGPIVETYGTLRPLRSNININAAFAPIGAAATG